MGPTVRELCPNTGFGASFGVTGADNRMTNVGHGVRWYALHVRHQHERQIEKLLRYQGWATLAPMYRSQRQWSDRVKEIELPIFAGYIFCQFAPEERARVEDTPGILQVVKFLGQPAAIEEHEIAGIQAMVASKVQLTPWPYLKVGDRVRVERGPLRGLEGTLLRGSEGSRLVVGVEMLQRSIAAEVDPEMVTPLRARAAGVQ